MSHIISLVWCKLPPNTGTNNLNFNTKNITKQLAEAAVTISGIEENNKGLPDKLKELEQRVGEVRISVSNAPGRDAHGPVSENRGDNSSPNAVTDDHEYLANKAASPNHDYINIEQEST